MSNSVPALVQVLRAHTVFPFSAHEHGGSVCVMSHAEKF